MSRFLILIFSSSLIFAAETCSFKTNINTKKIYEIDCSTASAKAEVIEFATKNTTNTNPLVLISEFEDRNFKLRATSNYDEFYTAYYFVRN